MASIRALWSRTSHAFDAAGGGFKGNTPDGWATDPPNSPRSAGDPFWWTGSDSIYDYMAPKQGFAAITKAASIIVNRIATSTWAVDEGPPPRWIADPMLVRQDARYPSSPWPAPLRLPGPYFWGQWVRQALLGGMGWMIFAEDANGQPYPGSMHLLGEGAVSMSGDGSSLRQINSSYGNIELDAENRFYLNGNPWRLLELRCPTTPLNPATGFAYGTLQYHAAELGLLGEIANYSSGTFSGSGVPSGYLKVANPQLTQPQADALKAQWLAAHGGGRRSVAVLTSMVDYQAVQVSPVDAALADMKRLSLVDVANAFCVPLFMLGAPAGHSNVYSNVETEQKALWTHTLMPWARCIEATLSALLPLGTELKLSLPSIEELPG